MSTLSQRQQNLPAIIQSFGGNLLLVNGWQTWGRGPMNPIAAQVHWTATRSASPSNPMPTLHVVRNGWGGLRGPLYNGLVGQDGRIALVSVRRCNHSGRGNRAALNAAAARNRRLPWNHRPGPDDMTINAHAWAVSADHSGSGQMPTAQRRGLIVITAAILELEQWSENRIYHHATSTQRKVDVRSWPDLVPHVKALRDGTASSKPPPKNRAALEEYAMKTGQSDSKDFDGMPVIEDWQNFCNFFLYATRFMVKTHADRHHIEVMDDLGKSYADSDGFVWSNLRADGEFGPKTQSASWQVIVRTGYINKFSIPGRGDSYGQNQITPSVQAAAWTALDKYLRNQ